MLRHRLGRGHHDDVGGRKVQVGDRIRLGVRETGEAPEDTQKRQPQLRSGARQDRLIKF